MVLCHRGIWSSVLEQNSQNSFKLAALQGMGIELDIRDYRAELVVSHNVPLGNEPKLAEVLAELVELNYQGYLALNVKSDGLLDLIQKDKNLNQIQHFFFDMAAPEAVQYRSRGLACATRLSEVEETRESPRVEAEPGIYWLDSFFGDWWLNMEWDDFFPRGAKVFVVSPELHGRDHNPAWEKVLTWIQEGKDVGVCTDYPQEFLERMARIYGD